MGPCDNRSEEDRYLHNPWTLQDQDPSEASHQGRGQDGFRPGDESEGETSQDCREGLSSCRPQSADLNSVRLHVLDVLETCLLWESHGTGSDSQAPLQVADVPMGSVCAPSTALT